MPKRPRPCHLKREKKKKTELRRSETKQEADRERDRVAMKRYECCYFSDSSKTSTVVVEVVVVYTSA